MKDHIFEKLLRAERDRVLPTCPSNLEANVLRRVRLAASPEQSLSSWDWVFGLMPQKMAGAGFIAAVAVLSVFASATMTSSSLKAEESRNLAMSSLDFGVFEKTPILNFED